MGAGDQNQPAGSVPVNCTLQTADGSSTTAIAFTDGNSVSIAAHDDNSPAPAPTLSLVGAMPSTGTLGAGQWLEAYFQESHNMNDLSLGACSVNGVAVSPLSNLSNGLYKVVYSVGSGDSDAAAGMVPIDCTLFGAAGTTTASAWTDSNTVAIDVAGDGIGTSTATTTGSTDGGSIGGTVEGGSDTATGTLAVTSINQVRSTATAGAGYADGWAWTFHVTVPQDETSVAMKFMDWTHSNGSTTIATAHNVRISSAQASSASTTEMTAADTYSEPLTITGDLDSSLPGRQIDVTVEMQVPSGALNGSYTTNYGFKSWH